MIHSLKVSKKEPSASEKSRIITIRDLFCKPTVIYIGAVLGYIINNIWMCLVYKHKQASVSD